MASADAAKAACAAWAKAVAGCDAGVAASARADGDAYILPNMIGNEEGGGQAWVRLAAVSGRREGR